jgi:hypothetical protein
MTEESASVVASPVAALGDVAQQAAHDLAGAGLGQLGHDHDRLGLGDRTDLLGHVVAQVLDDARVVVGGVGVRAQDDEGHDGLTGGLVVGADDRGLGDPRVADQRRLDLGRRQAVAGDVHDVVDPAEQPDVALLVLLGAVAGEVVLRPAVQ